MNGSPGRCIIALSHYLARTMDRETKDAASSRRAEGLLAADSTRLQHWQDAGGFTRGAREIHEHGLHGRLLG